MSTPPPAPAVTLLHSRLYGRTNAARDAADHNTIAAACWTIATVGCIALFALAEDSR
ncbi:hypothetical protein [Streptomyces sp. NPDC096095]|uniref:hypothetical protein n=1 Tax=Streptomyces sp. NPDC096095 TaxID=3155545 RepID=UPI00331CC7BB